MDGIILINKEKGMTSHDVVSKIRKILNTKKVGHAGTLDPLATGVLPILVGKGTKLSKYLIEHDKTYIATIKLGERTSTGDCEGEVVEKKEYKTHKVSEVEQVLNTFIGKQIQIPPMYSAIKVNGKKLYEYARNGEKVEIPKREIEIYNIELVSLEENILKFKVSCSKGTYIRSLCEDIAKKLETVGTMVDLQRIQVDKFKIQDAVSIEKITESSIIPIEQIFNEKQKIILNDTELKKFLNGIGIESNLEIALVYNNEKFIGIAQNRNGKLIRDIVI